MLPIKVTIFDVTVVCLVIIAMQPCAKIFEFLRFLGDLGKQA